MRSKFVLLFVIAATLFAWSISISARQNQGAAPVPRGRGNAGRGARQGPAGPLPRLPDGHPDLTGIWNGFGGSGADAPVLLDEHVHSVHLSSGHAAAQLVERLAWAISDAEQAEPAARAAAAA